MDEINMENKTTQQSYADELKCIQQIVSYSESFVERDEQFDINAVQSLLNERQPWIDILKNIEKELKNNNDQNNEIDHLKQKIAEMGNSLIAIDAKIMDVLFGQKQEIIKELMKNTDNINRRRGSETPRIINIKQE